MRCSDCIVRPDGGKGIQSHSLFFALQKTVKYKLYEPECRQNEISRIE